MDLELKIISATDLKKPNPFSKLRAYVVVSVSGTALPAQKTPVDADGGSNPNWNHLLRFSVPGAGAHNLRLKFQIHHRSVAADKLVGEVCVPLQELLNSASGEKIPSPVNFVRYQVSKPSGRPNGILTFSYKLNRRISGEPPPAKIFPAKHHTTSTVYPAPADVYPPPLSPPAMGYPLPTKLHTNNVVYPPAVDVYPPPPMAHGYNHDVYPPPASVWSQGGYGYGSECRYGSQMGYTP